MFFLILWAILEIRKLDGERLISQLANIVSFLDSAYPIISESGIKPFEEFYCADRWYNLENRAVIVSVMQKLATNREHQLFSATIRIYPCLIVSDRICS